MVILVIRVQKSFMMLLQKEESVKIYALVADFLAQGLFW